MDNIYNEILLDHHLHPLHRDEKINSTAHFSATNASCGDKLEFSFEIHSNIIAAVSFSGSGCAISQASADMMADLLIGKTINEAVALSKKFRNLITNGQVDEELEDANSLCDIAKMPARTKCAELAWSVIEKLVAIV